MPEGMDAIWKNRQKFPTDLVKSNDKRLRNFTPPVPDRSAGAHPARRRARRQGGGFGRRWPFRGCCGPDGRCRQWRAACPLCPPRSPVRPWQMLSPAFRSCTTSPRNRPFPQNAGKLQKMLQFSHEKGRFPIDRLVIIGV